MLFGALPWCTVLTWPLGGQDWSEFTDWPSPLGVWHVDDAQVSGAQWAQQIHLMPGAPWQLVRWRSATGCPKGAAC